MFDPSGLLVSTEGEIAVPGEQSVVGSYSFAEGRIEAIELLYYSFDFRWMSVNAVGPDSPARIVQPVWRFIGHSLDGLKFEILLPAALPEDLIAVPGD